jgi:DNA-binding IclR family transcriptional regulator
MLVNSHFSTPGAKKSYTSSSLLRALDMLDVAASGPIALAELAARLHLTRSTAYRIASALVERGLLKHNSRKGYQLGPRLLALGCRAQESTNLVAIAQPVLDQLSSETSDAINLAIRDGDDLLYIARSDGRRRLAVRHSVDDRNLITATALGRALLWDRPIQEWRSFFPHEDPAHMYSMGFASHFEDEEDAICCVAAPIRGASGEIVAALSLSSARHYMPATRVETVGRLISRGAATISQELGWRDRPARVGLPGALILNPSE